MVTLFQTDKTYKLTDVKAAMIQQLRLLPRIISSTGDPLNIFRYEIPCEPIDLLTWLHNQKISQKIYWSNRDGQFEMAGIGIAESIDEHTVSDCAKLFEYMEDRLASDNPNLRFYGGFSFHDILTSDEWRPYQHCRFIIPQFELFQAQGQTKFAFNIPVHDITPEHINVLILILKEIDFSPTTTYRSAPVVQSREDIPDRQEWDTIFQAVKNNFDKIVLARKSTFKFDKAINPVALLKHLKDQTNNCYHFCFQVDDYKGFLGASPERLYRKDNKEIESEAIAGTNARGQNTIDDEKLEAELLNSKKNALEHKYVVDAITEALDNLCASLKVDDTFSLLKLQEGQHLITRFFGQLKDNVTNHDILTALHPTPAVAGSPTENVLQALKKVEPFDRGWYAGPFGYVGYDSSEFAVAIRSGLVDYNHLSLFAGAGIVEGSDAASEWNEIEAKISNFIKVFDKS